MIRNNIFLWVENMLAGIAQKLLAFIQTQAGVLTNVVNLLEGVQLLE